MSIDVKKIHEASMKILEKTGVKFHHPDAVKVLKDHGIRMEGDVAHFTEEQIMKYVKLAPSSVTIYAKNPGYNVTLGSGVTYNAPCAGATEIMELLGKEESIARIKKGIELLETTK